MQRKPRFSGILLVAVLMVVVLLFVSLSPLVAASASKHVNYSDIYYYFQNQQVTSYRLDRNTNLLEMWLKEGKKPLPEDTSSTADLPSGGLLTNLSGSQGDDDELPANGGTVYVSYKLPYGGDFNTGKITEFVDAYNEANPDAPMIFDYVAVKTSVPWLEIIFYSVMLGSVGMLFMSMYRGGAGGYTMYLPEKDPSYVTKTAMFENIVTLLGGRVAEQLVLEDIYTGASSDLQRATDTARAMVTRYGFSERMGPVVYGSDPGETFLGRDFGQGKGYSEAIASEIDNEIRDIVDEAYETARRTLTEHMNELHKVAGVLMEREKISGEEFKTLMEGGTLPPYDLGRGETAQPVAPAPDSAAPVQPAEQPETQQPAEPANPQPDTQE